MFHTLYSRLALTLFSLFIIVGASIIILLDHTGNLYQQEVNQKLNAEVANHIISEHELITDGEVNHAILNELFHELMIINPSIELYLLDAEGNILSKAADEASIMDRQINLEPIRIFISGNRYYPLYGDNPRDNAHKKAFSASPIVENGKTIAYLYIILGGEHYDAMASMIEDSYILETTSMALLIALLFALSGGLIVFAYLTRRLKALKTAMYKFETDSQARSEDKRYPYESKTEDEIDQLGQQFNRMAEQIDSQIEELKQMDNMRRELITNVSHDLRTPLTTLRGYLETMQLNGDKLTREQQSHYLQTAISHSQQLGQLIEELFELARLDSCESAVYSEPFSICELAQDVSQKYLLAAQERDITLVTDIDPNTPLVNADIAMMQRVLENLIDNALRHTPEGGQVHVFVNTNANAVTPASVTVRIEDTGVGIPDDALQRIFDRFYQHDRFSKSAGAAGLGLAIVKRILELHQSAINVSSKLGQGTTFSFELASVSG